MEEEKIKNARVGTIDKFQGQEAPVNIISMTSSDSETLPRNKEFFFDKNRLNVAISRAQVVSIILFNPKLLEFFPKNINQMKLMNNFFEKTVVEKIKFTSFEEDQKISTRVSKSFENNVTKNKHQNQINNVKNEKIKESLLELTKVFKEK